LQYHIYTVADFSSSFFIFPELQLKIWPVSTLALRLFCQPRVPVLINELVQRSWSAGEYAIEIAILFDSNSRQNARWSHTTRTIDFTIDLVYEVHDSLIVCNGQLL